MKEFGAVLHYTQDTDTFDFKSHLHTGIANRWKSMILLPRTNTEHVSAANLYLHVSGSNTSRGTTYPDLSVLWSSSVHCWNNLYTIAGGLWLPGCVYIVYSHCLKAGVNCHTAEACMYVTSPISDCQCLEASGGIISWHTLLGGTCCLHLQADRITSMSLTNHCNWAINSRYFACNTSTH